MANKKKSVIPWFLILFVGIVIWAILADYSKDNPLVFWPVAFCLMGGAGYALYRFPELRGKFWGATKFVAKDLAYSVNDIKEDSPPKRPISEWMKKVVEARANGKCENPDCPDRRETLFPWIHHIDGNPEHHIVTNLAFLCRNCSAKADHGAYRKETVRRWTNTNYRHRKYEVDSLRRSLGH